MSDVFNCFITSVINIAILNEVGVLGHYRVNAVRLRAKTFFK